MSWRLGVLSHLAGGWRNSLLGELSEKVIPQTGLLQCRLGDKQHAFARSCKLLHRVETPGSAESRNLEPPWVRHCELSGVLRGVRTSGILPCNEEGFRTEEQPRLAIPSRSLAFHSRAHRWWCRRAIPLEVRSRT